MSLEVLLQQYLRHTTTTLQLFHENTTIMTVFFVFLIVTLILLFPCRSRYCLYASKSKKNGGKDLSTTVEAFRYSSVYSNNKKIGLEKDTSSRLFPSKKENIMMEENDSSNANGEETEEQKSLFWKSRRKTNALSKKLLPKLRNTLLRPYMHNQHSSDDDDDSFEMKHDESFGANVEIGENGLVIVRSSSDAVVADRNAARRGERKEMEGSNFYDGDGNDDGDDNDDDITTHFCFLVHGYRGTPNHLSYLQSKMVNVASETLSQGKVNTSSHSTPLLRKHEQHQQLVMYRCRCNMNRTSDGIERGGERIYEEVLSVIRSFIRDKQELRRSSRNKEEREIASVTISMVGNSLGGLYSRYALAKLSELSKKQQQTYHNGNNKRIIENEGKESNSFIVIDGTIRIYFNIFCSTASPHLGVSGHTWFPIPRTAEIGLAQAMGDTGKSMLSIIFCFCEHIC